MFFTRCLLSKSNLILCSPKPFHLLNKPIYRTTIPTLNIVRYSSTSNNENKNLTARQKLQNAVKDYGSTVLVFHITISLISLGGFYLAVYSGLDLVNILKSIGITLNDQSSLVAGRASTFVIAYAIHKVFAPVRISVTLVSVPFVVRYLRRIGILKAPLKK
ncbi:protein FAM210B, mitochondrial-like isoform X3 [Planococcus citri]|uniref:protein FAM210B, mitochondrial-like isoform X3 n=1 Tax=Planococcus citri TaxID=170843 RepID=UPI0031F85175